MNNVIRDANLRRHMNFVVDVFAGMDGSLHFMKLCKAINKWEKQSLTDPVAAERLEVVRKFSQLVVSIE
jgi:hypothetical protein